MAAPLKWGGGDDVITSISIENDRLWMLITGEMLNISIYFFLQNVMSWNALSFENDELKNYFDITWPLSGEKL